MLLVTLLSLCVFCYPIRFVSVVSFWDRDTGQLVGLHFLLRQEQGVKLTLIRPATVYVALSKSPNEAEHGTA